MAIDFQKMFEEELAKSGTGYEEQIKEYQNSQKAEEQALQAQQALQQVKLQKDKQNSQQDAYVAKRMAEKNMPQMLAAQGLTGGMAETTASNIFNDYLKSNTAAENRYSTANSEMQNSYMTNSAALKTKYSQLLSEARQKQRDDAFARAQWAHQTSVEEAERKRKEEEAKQAQAAKGGSKGSSGGHSVASIQQLLNNAGYALDVDGKWGPNTATAVRRYQLDHGLTMDGIVGRNTWASLNG